MSKVTSEQIKEAAERDLSTFIKLVAPQLLLGSVHEEVIRWWTREEAKKNQLLLLPRGHLKVLKAEEPVLLSDGTWKKTIELELGDKLSDPTTGKEQYITQLHPLGEDDYYRITFDDGRTIDCGSGHLWEIEQHGFKEGPIVRDTEWILTHYKSEDPSYVEYKTSLKAPVPLEFPEKELVIEPYVLGAWLGDKNRLEGEITDFISSFGYKIRNSKYGYVVLGLRKKLKQLGIKNKHIPQHYLQGSIKQRLELLRGLLDTGGTVSNGIISLQTENRNEIAYLIRSLGGKVKEYYTPSVKSWSLSIWLPKELGNPFKLKRKVKLYDEVVKFQPWMLKTWITDIIPIGRHVSRCISVSNPRGLYVANNFIVTHNSKLMALRVAQWVVKNPDTTILYVSATADLAEKQLYAIKNILDSAVIRRYWPDLINIDEGKREKWSVAEIAVDHIKRKKEGVRDPTIKAAGLTTNTTGFHADIIVMDDVVVPGNAYTEEGRSKVEAAYSQFASIENPGAQEWVVGTRYHPQDIYSILIAMKETVYNKAGDVEREDSVYEILQKVVEEQGEFLWPKQMRADGKYFGFDENELARIKAKYIDKTQFYAQYYNNPNNAENSPIDPGKFQYYERKLLRTEEGVWFYKESKLNIYSSIDFAFSLNKKADYTALVTIGVDSDWNVYILDIDRFKTNRIADYFKHIVDAHYKWGFRKIRAEVTVAQQTIVQELKESYIKPNGLALSIDEYRPNRHQGDKEERILSVLQPKYDNLQVWHYRGGNCQTLEEELILQHPPHDDIKDALANAIAIAIAPRKNQFNQQKTNVIYSSRFGGISFRG